MSWLSRIFDFFRFEPIPEPDLSPDDPPDGEVAGELDALLFAHQAARSARGLRPAVRDELLVRAAQKHAEWMAANRRMSHYGAGGSSFGDRVAAEGYRMAAGGENVAGGYETWKAAFDGWMASSPHKRNILRDVWTRIGLGVATDRNGKRYWCAVFAVPEASLVARSQGVQLVSTLDYLPEPLEASAA